MQTNDIPKYVKYYYNALKESSELEDLIPNTRKIKAIKITGNILDTDNWDISSFEETILNNETDTLAFALALSKGSQDKYVLYIPFELEDNKIVASNKGPIIIRDCLEPFEGKKYPIIGDLEQFWESRNKHFENKQFNSFKDYLIEVNKFWLEIADKKIGEEIQNHSWGKLTLVALNPPVSKSLLELYEVIRTKDNSKYYSHILERFSGEDIEICSENDLDAAQIHLGHIKNFPLSQTQREAVHTWLTNDSIQNENGHIRVLAVNGPPGTGKTTVLSTIIANHIVKCALEERATKFIMTSFSNKAVTNIIDSLSSIEDKEKDKDKKDDKFRWLDIKWSDKSIGLCVFFPSGSNNKKDDYIHIQYSKDGATGSLVELEKSCFNDRKNIISAFKKKAHESLRLGENADLDHIYKAIHKKLKTVSESISNSDKHTVFLDERERREATKWAIRLFECKWLQGLNGFKIEDFKRNDPKITEWRMLLTPCVVGTLFMLPKFFKKEGSGDYRFQDADYLIIDEAGQVPPEKGFPLFGLAKNAIIVGDTEQLQPIWDITSEWDKSIREEFEVDNIMSVSAGSVMAMAQRACQVKRSSYDIRGVVLKNHRRCYDEIIQISNQLCYENLRIPLETNTVPKNSSYYDVDVQNPDPVPPLKMIEVNGGTNRRNGNKTEATALVDWIEENWERIVDRYVKKEDGVKLSKEEKLSQLKNVLAILTPYRAQRKLIQEGIESKFNESVSKGLTIGTVHSLQGAEYPVVLFSTALDGKTGNPDFIDVYMLNVAVSRAKYSFIVFTNPNLYTNLKEDKPLKVVKEYIDNWAKEHPEPQREVIALPSEELVEPEQVALEEGQVISELRKKIKQLVEDKEDLKNLLNCQDNYLNETNAKISEIMKENEMLAQSNESLSKMNDSLSEQNTELVKENNSLTSERNRLKEEKENIENKLEEIRSSPKSAFRNLRDTVFARVGTQEEFLESPYEQKHKK